MEEPDKAEVQKLLAQLRPEPNSRLTRLFLKIGAGYAAMAVFTAVALLYCSSSLYLINRNARQRIANTEIPVVTALIKMRASLLAQENFAGKYAIFRDPAFIRLFRQRSKDTTENLEVLLSARSVPNVAGLKQLYGDYQAASEGLFTGASHDRQGPHAVALQLMSALDELYIERQGMLQALLDRADELQRSTIRWAIGVSCSGLLLAALLARFSIYRVARALEKLQKETHKMASGDFSYHRLDPAVEEISDLADDFNEIATKIAEMEQMNQDALPLTRLPGNLAIERVLDQRLASGAPFSFCHLELDNFQQFLARYGYARSGKLLFDTGVLIHRAVRTHGAEDDFAGHAGGGNFVFVVTPERAASVCEAVVIAFDAEMVKHLGPEDREAQGIAWCAGGGDQRFSPVTTVSIAVLDCDIRTYPSAVEIARAAVTAQAPLKREAGSCWGRAAGQEGVLP